MKTINLLLLFLFCSTISLGQDVPHTITPQTLQKNTARVELEAKQFRKEFVNQERTKAEIEFSIDTFKLQKTAAWKMEVDFSTLGMNEAISELTKGYDKLLNKYYTMLLQMLDANDKKTLIAAQKAWLTFRDAENMLIAVMAKEKYSGGGTIQSIIATSHYSSLVVKRTEDIFNYYNGVIKEN